SYRTTKTAVFRRFQASAAEQGARRAWFLSDAESFGFHGFSLGPWLLWLSLPVLLALMVVASLCSCGFCLWLALLWTAWLSLACMAGVVSSLSLLFQARSALL
ncbi:MAG: hypothetical protein ACLR9V_10440, partial [Bifidobacterium catenulatum]